MIEILRKLEPRTEPAGKILFNTIEEVHEVFFCVKGSIEVGFEISREPKYVVRLQKGGVIGIYNVTFNKRTMFLYKVRHEFHGFTIRKDNWRSIMSNPEFQDLTCHIRNHIEDQFMKQIKLKVLKIYRYYIGRLKKRKDKEMILTVMNVNDDTHTLAMPVKRDDDTYVYKYDNASND